MSENSRRRTTLSVSGSLVSLSLLSVLVLLIAGVFSAAPVTAQGGGTPLSVGKVRGLDFSPDGAQIALGYADRVDIRDRVSGTLIRELPAPVWASTWGNGAIDWHPRLARLAVAQAETVTVWDTETGAEIRTFPLAGRFVQFAWHPDAERLIVGLLNGSLIALDPVKGEAQTLFEGDQAILALAVSPDGERLAFSQHSVAGEFFVFSPPGDALQGVTSPAPDRYPPVVLAWGPPGSTLVAVYDQGDMRGHTLIWDMETAQVRSAQPLPPISMVVWHAEKPIFAAITHVVDAEADQATVALYDADGVQIVAHERFEAPPRFIAWAGDTLAIVDRAGNLLSWDALK